jgi:hypothetical protein
MSYHILHQFDEQWLTDLKLETDRNKHRRLLDSLDDGYPVHEQRTRFATRESKRWAIITSGILLATFALLFSIDASRRAASLQQRVDALEQTARK